MLFIDESTNGDPGAHGNDQGKQSKMNGAKQNERGQELMRAVGMAGKGWQQAHSPQNKPLQADTASGFSARHRPQDKRPQMAGLAAKQQLQTNVGLPLAVQCR